MKDLFFQSWDSIARAAVSTTLAYIAILILLRTFGKRTLSKMNAFDFIVTIALGSCLAAISLNKSISVSEGIAAFCVLMGLQYLITWLSVRYKWVKKVVTSKPALLLYKGEFLRKEMKEERVTEEELLVALRENGDLSVENTYAVVLESTGELTVISGNVESEKALEGVRK